MFPPAILSKARQLATVTPVCFPAARSWAAAKCLPVLLGSAMSDLGARHLTRYRREWECGSPSQLRGRAPVSHCNTAQTHSKGTHHHPKSNFLSCFFYCCDILAPLQTFGSQRKTCIHMKAPLINRKE